MISDSAYWGGLVVLIGSLSVLDIATGGMQRPLLVAVLLVGIVVLWLLARNTPQRRT